MPFQSLARNLIALMMLVISFSSCKRLSIRGVNGASDAIVVTGPCMASNPSGDSFGGGDGTIGNPYTICTVSHVEQLASFVTQAKYFKLEADIDLSTMTNQPIMTGDPCIGFGCLANAFKGDLDGNGHKLSDFSFDSTGHTYSGLFYAVQQGTIHDLVLENFNISGTGDYAGSLAGLVRMANVSNVILQGTNTNTAILAAGGLFGQNDSALISAGTYDGIAIAELNYNSSGAAVGGIIGETMSSITITNSNLGSSITSVQLGNLSGAFLVGGFVGSASSGFASVSISDSLIFANVQIDADLASGMSGGFVGSTSGTTNISHVINNGNSNSSLAGGLIGSAQGVSTTLYRTKNTGHIGGTNINNLVSGGLIGVCSGMCTIQESANHGLVEATSDAGGGLLARSTSSLTVSDSYNIGMISVTTGLSGGLVGDSAMSTNISDCYVSTILLTGGTVHAIAGSVEAGATITGTVWDWDLNPLSSDPWPIVNAGTHGYSNANMLLQGSFTGSGPPDVLWDFTNTWIMPGVGYTPALQWE